ncbi:hypothetical protein [Clostridium sp. JN-1]|uniref:hypothetical protein n=1 Tax=Clostridium sp. JN-1 TaxID=2483110 RepID=UPI000F0BD417|nr:hypothetical protein [Clostridium sp. JN-1]
MSEFFNVTLSSDVIIDDSSNGKNNTWSAYQINEKLSEMDKKIEENRFYTETLNKRFSYITFTTIANLNSISGTILNSVVDIANTSSIKSLSFKITEGNILLYGGVIPPQRAISFETQRTDLIIQVDGDGTINMITKHIGPKEAAN